MCSTDFFCVGCGTASLKLLQKPVSESCSLLLLQMLPWFCSLWITPCTYGLHSPVFRHTSQECHVLVMSTSIFKGEFTRVFLKFAQVDKAEILGLWDPQSMKSLLPVSLLKLMTIFQACAHYVSHVLCPFLSLWYYVGLAALFGDTFVAGAKKHR